MLIDYQPNSVVKHVRKLDLPDREFAVEFPPDSSDDEIQQFMLEHELVEIPATHIPSDEEIDNALLVDGLVRVIRLV